MAFTLELRTKIEQGHARLTHLTEQTATLREDPQGCARLWGRTFAEAGIKVMCGTSCQVGKAQFF